MRILVEPSEFRLLNIGDMAMQQIAVTRIARLWPHADIQVLTDAPDELPPYAPNVRPLSAMGRHLWSADGYLFWGYRHLPLTGSAIKWERRLRQTRPRWVERCVRFKMKVRCGGDQPLSDYLHAVRNADLLVVCGMGAITDTFEGSTLGLLNTIELAKTQGKAFVAMFGQGIGPITNGHIEQRARRVLPLVDFIALREGRGGEPLLRRLGVAADRIVTTGDDALELAFHPQAMRKSDGIGVNVRASAYARVGQSLCKQLQDTLIALAKQYSAPLVPVPTSLYPEEADDTTLTALVGKANHGGQRVNSPATLVSQLQNCRLLITGSYHAGIFALGQGIPIIGLYNSAYYRDKFLGIATQFGVGVETVELSDSAMPAVLRSAVERAWDQADAIRPQLLAAAERQISASRAAYERVFELVGQQSDSRLQPITSGGH